jgi:Flp pilus assembly protein TadG
MTRPDRPRARRGAIAPLTALLLIPLLAMLAFAVDLGYIVVIQSDLQNAADSSALAGAQALTAYYAQYNLPGLSGGQQAAIVTSAKAAASAAAKQYAGLNAAGVPSLTLLDSDIEYGFTDHKGNYTASTSSTTTFPNTVKVTLRRDGSANTPVGLFFGPVLGVSSTGLQATAAAAIYLAPVDNLLQPSPLNLLPMTVDVNWWNNFLASGVSPDGSYVTDPNGLPAMKVYSDSKSTGNFGLLSLDDSHTGSSSVVSWINNGMTSNDLSALKTASSMDTVPLLPLSQHTQNVLPSAAADGLGSWNWQGNTGFQGSDVHTLDNEVGQVYLLPLYKPYQNGTVSNGNGNSNTSSSGYAAGYNQGSNYYYNIVQFVSVKIVSSDRSNGVVVQPFGKPFDPTQVTFGATPVPAGSGNSSSWTSYTFATPKLVQ